MSFLKYARRAGRPLARVAATAVTRLTSTRRINGALVRLPRRAARHMLPFVAVRYEREEWDAVIQFGRAGQSYLDVGANIGVIAVAMARTAGSRGRVLAIEPQPAVYCVLAQTLVLNDCANAIPLQALVADHCGTAPFYISEATELGVGSSMFETSGKSTVVRLPAVTIDALYPDPERIDFIKIDAEGAERRILQGASKVLGRCRPLVQVEVHGEHLRRGGDSIAELFGDMTLAGYDCANLATGRVTHLDAFEQDTGYHVRDPDGDDLAYRGYGQVLFFPVERQDVRDHFGASAVAGAERRNG